MMWQRNVLRSLKTGERPAYSHCDKTESEGSRAKRKRPISK